MSEVYRAERQQLHARNPQSLDAYSLCLCGEEELLSLNKASCETARSLFKEAMSHCHDYARAQASIARTHGFMWKYRWSPDRDRELELAREAARSEEHTSELQSLMRISYAVFCLKKKKKEPYIQ